MNETNGMYSTHRINEKIHTKLWSENFRGRVLGGYSRGGDDNIKMDLKEIGYESWTGLIWLRIGISGGTL
jgi:hypothetical protein